MTARWMPSDRASRPARRPWHRRRRHARRAGDVRNRRRRSRRRTRAPRASCASTSPASPRRTCRCSPCSRARRPIPIASRAVIAATTARLYDRGYVLGKLAATSTLDCGGTVVHVVAALGPRYTIGRLDVTGSALPVTPASFERNFGEFDQVGATYAPDAFVEDLDDLADQHRATGWFDVHMTLRSVDRDDAHHTSRSRRWSRPAVATDSR